MLHVLGTVAWFCVVWAGHIMWFRIAPPRLKLRALLYLFAAGFVLLSAGLVWAGGGSGPPAGRDAFRIALPLTSLLLYAQLAFAYVIIFSAVEVESPSAKLILLIASSGRAGMTYPELRRVMTDERLVRARVDDLVAAGTVVFDGTAYRVLPGGARWARLFASYRRLIGRPLGG